MTRILIIIGLLLSLLGTAIMKFSKIDTETGFLILASLGAGNALIGYGFGYTHGAFEASQFLKEKYVLTDKE